MLSPHVVEEVQIDICADCVIYLENADASGIEESEVEQFLAAFREGIKFQLDGRRGIITLGDTEADPFWSTSPCELCRRKWDGNRYAAVILFDGFSIGQRVEAHPGCDCWIAGDRFGKVVKNGVKYVHVKMDRSGKIRHFPPDRIFHR